MNVCEKASSRVIRDGEKPTAETQWLIWENDESLTVSELEAQAALYAVLPTSYTFQSGRTAGLTALQIKEDSDFNWTATASYSVFEPKAANDVEYEFEAGTQSITLTHSLGTTPYTGGGRVAPDFSGGINVSSDGKVQGIQTERPKFSFSLTKYWPTVLITGAYQFTIAGLAGAVNSVPYATPGGTFPAGSLKFLGSSGRINGNQWPITYRFEYSPNETNVTVGDITVASRDGWDYLDVYRRTIEDTTSKKKIEVPHSAYVHQVSPRADFALLAL